MKASGSESVPYTSCSTNNGRHTEWSLTQLSLVYSMLVFVSYMNCTVYSRPQKGGAQFKYKNQDNNESDIDKVLHETNRIDLKGRSVKRFLSQEDGGYDYY